MHLLLASIDCTRMRHQCYFSIAIGAPIGIHASGNQQKHMMISLTDLLPVVISEVQGNRRHKSMIIPHYYSMDTWEYHTTTFCLRITRRLHFFRHWYKTSHGVFQNSNIILHAVYKIKWPVVSNVVVIDVSPCLAIFAKGRGIVWRLDPRWQS